MADTVIDFAGLDSTAPVVDAGAPEVDTSVVDSGVEVDAGKTGSETPAGTEKSAEGADKDAGQPEVNADGIPKEKVEELPGNDKTPQEIRKALAALKKSDPTNAKAVGQLHREFENSLAFKQVFPSVQEARDAKTFIESFGGHEGFAKLQDTLANVEAVDAKLYDGDPTLWDDLVSDLKESNHLDALGKLAPSFLDKLKSEDSKAYYDTFAPHLMSALTEVNMTGALASLAKALGNSDPAAGNASAKEVVKGIQEWLQNLQGRVEKQKASAIDPERKKLQEERAAFNKQQQEFKTNQTKEFQGAVAKDLDKGNNQLLGSQLKSYLKMPFFQGFTRENLIPLGNNIKQNLFEALKADTAYQAQMKTLWAAKTPDKAKIEEYHKSKVESMSADIVRNTVQRMYPGYAKGGQAAGRVAAATAKKVATANTDKAAAATGKPIYIAQKPEWNAIDFDKDPKKLLFIAGKAYLKGSGKFVTWRKPQ